MSLNNRIDQLSQIRETTLEAAATNAETGITYHGAAAVYRLQERRSANSRGVKEQVHFDLGDPAEVEKLRVSVTRRGAASVPNRKRPEWESSSPSDKQPLPVGSADAQDATEKGPTTTEEPVSAPFPTRKVLYIIATQILSSAPGVMFAAVAPYMYAALIGNFQTAGTVSSIATGVSMVLQMLFTPIAAQVMDLYGRKKLAVFSAVKAVVAIVPLLVAGIVISTGSVPDGANATEAKLGGYLSDSSKRFVHFLFAAYCIILILYCLFGLTLSKTQFIIKALYANSSEAKPERKDISFAWCAVAAATTTFVAVGCNLATWVFTNPLEATHLQFNEINCACIGMFVLSVYLL